METNVTWPPHLQVSLRWYLCSQPCQLLTMGEVALFSSFALSRMLLLEVFSSLSCIYHFSLCVELVPPECWYSLESSTLKRQKQKLLLLIFLSSPGPISLLFWNVVYSHSPHLLMLSLLSPSEQASTSTVLLRPPMPKCAWPPYCQPSALSLFLSDLILSAAFEKWTTTFFSWRLWHHPFLVFTHIIGHTISNSFFDSFCAQTVPVRSLR